jgi:citrate synthase
MTDYDQHRGKIYSVKGGWRVGSGITTHGYSLLDEIHGRCSVFQVIIMNVTGRLPERRLADFVEGFFVCLSWPDARIWCNKMGTFSAMTRTSATAAVAAGGLAGDSKMYGPGSGPAVDAFLKSAHEYIVEGGGSVENFIDENGYRGGRLYAPGFARPLAKGDERITAMRRYAQELGFEPGVYEKLANQIEDHLALREGEGLNLAGYFAAFMYDRGYSMREAIGISAWSISTGVYASYFEQIDRPPEAFLALQVGDIEYTGPAPREVPERDD